MWMIVNTLTGTGSRFVSDRLVVSTDSRMFDGGGVITARVDGATVGSLTYEGSGQVTRINVYEAARRQGVGTALWSAVPGTAWLSCSEVDEDFDAFLNVVAGFDKLPSRV